MTAKRRAGAPRTSRVVAITLTASVLALAAEIGAGVAVRNALDQAHEVSAVRLDAAMQTFRPAGRGGLAKTVAPADLDPASAVRTDPSRCSALTVLALRPAQDGQSWTGINGTPAQPVTTLTARYADAAQARSELRTKQVALLTCRTVELTFPPFTAPAVPYVVGGRLSLDNLRGDRLSYTLSGGGKLYGFYVRRYENTLTWTYADDVSTPQVRQQVADSLVTRLRDLERQ